MPTTHIAQTSVRATGEGKLGVEHDKTWGGCRTSKSSHAHHILELGLFVIISHSKTPPILHRTRLRRPGVALRKCTYVCTLSSEQGSHDSPPLAGIRGQGLALGRPCPSPRVRSPTPRQSHCLTALGAPRVRSLACTSCDRRYRRLLSRRILPSGAHPASMVLFVPRTS